MVNSNQVKTALIFSWILIIINTLALYYHPLPGYVFSFYEFLPEYFWINSIMVFLITSVVLIHSRSIYSLYSCVCLVLIIVNSMIILLSPYVCGAFLMSGGDLPSHVGMVVDIINTGHINFNIVHYPLSHVLASFIMQVTSLNQYISVIILAPIFSLVLPFYLYSLAKTVVSNYYICICSFLIGSTFYLSSLFQSNSITTPNALSFLWIPLLFYLLIRCRKSGTDKSYGILLILCLAASILFHPLTNVVLSILFVTLLILDFVLKDRSKTKYYIGLFISLFFAYLLYLVNIWVRPLKRIANLLIYDINPTITSSAVDIGANLDKLGVSGLDTLILLFKIFGHQIILLIASTVCLLIIVVQIIRRSFDLKANQNTWVLPVALLYGISGFFLLIQIIRPSTLDISFFRFLSYLMIFTPVLTSLLLLYFIKQSPPIMLTTILILFIGSLLVVYPSPYISQANPQVDLSDICGTNWYLDHKAAEIGSSGYFGNGRLIRLVSSIIPPEEYMRDRYSVWGGDQVPDHFGYNNFTTIGDTIRDERYIVVSKFDLTVYNQVYASINRLTKEDVNQLYADPYVNLIYQNGGLDISLVNCR